MATTMPAVRLPFAPRAPHQLSTTTTISPLNTKKGLSAVPKRPRSPELHNAQVPHDNAKRHKLSTTQDGKDKERRKAEREVLKEEFRVKYTKAFPTWTFYFDTSDAERDALSVRVQQLNGRVARFFSNEVTHFVTNRSVPGGEGGLDKENSSKTRASGSASLRSPIKLKGVNVEETSASGYDTLMRKAVQFGMKIWDTAKLNSVLDRCYVPAPGQGSQVQARSLTSLLESERRHGTTSERDPTQKRHDYHYFSKGSYFVLVEDIQGELATIAALEYPVTKTSDGKEKGGWPVPYCHPLSRGPFVEYNEKEERRRERQERVDKEREEQRVEELKRQKMKQLQRKQHDLRRSVSMNNLQRQALNDHGDLGGETYEVYDTTNAGDGVSGHLASTGTIGLGSYVAASGNSVGITSTYGTTSTIGAGSSMRSGLGHAQFPPALRDRLQNHVVTSRRASVGPSVSRTSSASAMLMPPPDIPDRKPLLRKAKSTNTMRLPKRDEKSKPGYCESCRQKFEDFKVHVKGRRHMKFAENDANFAQLDAVLSRVRRPTIAEVEKAEREYQFRRLRDATSPLSDIGDDDDSGKENQIAQDEFVYLDDDDETME